MGLKRWAARRDENERAIVDGLRAVGADVWQISGTDAPDLLVRFRGRLSAFEVKTAKGKSTPGQEAADFLVVRSLGDALQAIGAGRPTPPGGSQ
jgi:hypothetical protein